MWHTALAASLRHIFSYHDPTAQPHFETARSDHSDLVADMAAILASAAPDSIRLWKFGQPRPQASVLEVQRGVNTSRHADTIEHAHDHFAYMLDYVVPAPGAGQSAVVEADAQRRAALMNALHDLTLLEAPPVTPRGMNGGAALSYAYAAARTRIPAEVRAHSPQLAERLDRAYASQHGAVTAARTYSATDKPEFHEAEYGSVHSDQLESLPCADTPGVEFITANEYGAR